MTADEQTPLLSNGHAGPEGKKPRGWLTRRLGLDAALDVEKPILLAGFLITLSFSFTQVPLFYVFHLMECDIFYDNHPPYSGPGDRCSRNEIAARTATDFSVLGMSTTTCGIINLFVAGWMVKTLGPRLALMMQSFVPAIRVAAQILGVIAGGQAGITIIQTTQLITLVGGPVGYILVINIVAGELVEPLRRTIVFGQLQGCIMLGQAIGYLSGGMIGDRYGIRRPFETAFCSFLLATLYVLLALPYVSPASLSGANSKIRGLSGFFSPLRVLVPQTIRTAAGRRLRKHYGVLFLCLGVFLGVLATGFAPMLIQMYATAVFEFDQGDNGYLMSGYAFCRALFLILLFPKIIDWGRKWFIAREEHEARPGRVTSKHDRDAEQAESFPTAPAQFAATMNSQADEEPVGGGVKSSTTVGESESDGCGFDLFFLRWSLLVDGLLTMGAAFATERWHIYLAAFLLPFGSGTAPATKGVITEMCPAAQRSDALNALTLVENIARLATQGFFGFVFAALAEAGKPSLTFYCNAAIAIVGMGVLMLSRFPPRGSTLVDGSEGDGDDTSEGTVQPGDEEREQGQRA